MITDLILEYRAGRYLQSIIKHIKKNDKTLDFGAGNCILSKLLQKKGFRITALDVKNTSRVDKIIKLRIYSGNKIPFRKEEFDNAFAISVLHHCKNPSASLKELRRVVKNRVIIYEPVYKNSIGKLILAMSDIPPILEGMYSPMNFLTEKEIREMIEDNNLRIIHEKQKRIYMGIIKMKKYILEPK